MGGEKRIFFALFEFSPDDRKKENVEINKFKINWCYT